ncbi:major facilitator superfamily domain-containing protein [Trichoderma chlorosporum]
MESDKNASNSTHHDELVAESADIRHITENLFTVKKNEHHDDALDFLQSTEDQNYSYTDQEAIRVRWKIDLMLMPLLLGTYTLNFLDKGILSNASVFGLKTDTHLVGQQYSWVASIFYFGYMVGQPVNAYMLHKVPMGKWLAGNVLGWGVCILLAITAKNFAGLATTRFFLGLFESVNNPAFVLITSQYYTRKEHSLRSCIWWAGNAVGSFFGDLIAYGIGHGHGPLSPWKYMFITFGGFSVLWSLVLMLFLPDSPWRMKFLSEREKRIAVLRVLSNHTGVSSSYWQWRQAASVLVDPQAWIFFCIAFIQCLPSGGLTAFNKLILTGLGYTNLEATIYSMPEHAIQLFGVIVAGIMGSYLKNARCIVIVLSNIPPLVGSFIVYYVPTSEKLTRLAGVYILFTNTISYIMVLSLVASNFAGMSRKTAVSAGIFLAYSAGNLVAPNLFIDSEAPLYSTGFRGMIASFLTLIVLTLILMAYLIFQNKRRDKKYGKIDTNTLQEDDLLDLTDKELHYFRYACNMRISLAASPNNQRQQEADSSHSEASHLNTKPNVSRSVNAHQERCAPEMDMREHQAPTVTTLTYADEESKWQPEYSTYSTKWNFQPTASSIDDTMGHHNSQRSESDLVEFNVLQASDVSDFEFSFGRFFDMDIEYPSWPDSTFSMDRLDYQLDDIGEGGYRRQPMDDPPLHEEKRAKFTDSPPKTDETSPSHVKFDDVYLTHFERLINNCGYSSKEDGKGNYLRFILDYIKSSHCSRDSPFRFAVLAWAAKHLAATSFSEDESWKTYYTQAVQALGRISCCGDSHDTSGVGAALPTSQYAISSKAELTISSALFLCRCDVLNGDSDSILSRLDNLKEHLTCHLSDPSLSALVCKFLLWLCYIDVRLRIFSSQLPSGDSGESNPMTTLLDALIHHPKYDYVLSRSHSYLSETFGYTYPPDELAQDEKKVPISVRTHETFYLISNMLQYRSWKHTAEQKPDFPGYHELAEAKETAISLDIRRMDTEFDLAIATNPAANTLRNVTSPSNNNSNCGTSTHMVGDNPDLHSLPPVTISRDIDRASLEWLSCYAAFLSAKVLWSRLLYPGVRSDSTAMVATSGILKIALQLRQLHRKSKLASLMKVPRSMLWPLPVFIAGIETTDEIYADWIREFMNEMASAMNHIARERSHITGEDLNHPRGNKTDHLGDQKPILVLMMRVRERQDRLGRRVDVQGIMSEADIANNVFLL